MSDQSQYYDQGPYQQSYPPAYQQPQATPEQQADAQQQAERERNALAQEAAGQRIDMTQLDGMIQQGYANIAQPGLEPANKPGNVLDAERLGERPAHKSTRDLEDITGNPGHRGCTPYAPATSFNRAPRVDGRMDSINEPPDVT